jgi:hypothetical protein
LTVGSPAAMLRTLRETPQAYHDALPLAAGASPPGLTDEADREDAAPQEAALVTLTRYQLVPSVAGGEYMARPSRKPARPNRPHGLRKRKKRPQVTTLVKLHVPSGTWAVIKSRAALARMPVSAYAVQLIAREASRPV